MTFKLPSPFPRQPRPDPIYRNPIVLAKELHAAMGIGGRPCDLAAELHLSRARITQLLRLLRLAPTAIEAIEQLGDRWPRRVIGEHALRGLVDLAESSQLRVIEKLTRSVSKPFPRT